jgi:hypothetical protein
MNYLAGEVAVGHEDDGLDGLLVGRARVDGVEQRGGEDGRLAVPGLRLVGV